MTENASNIYVVVGTTGEYSDRIEWPVIAYHSEVEAEEHVKAASRWLEQNVVPNRPYRPRLPDGVKNPYDPEMELDYTGTKWFIYTVPIASAPASAIEAAQPARRDSGSTEGESAVPNGQTPL